MTDYTRRRFIRAAASLGALTAGWLLTGCGDEEIATLAPATDTVPPTRTPPVATSSEGGETEASTSPTPESTEAPTSTVEPTSAPTETSGPQQPASGPDLVVARGGEPEVLVRRALAALGGMGQFVGRGDDVIIKPNICVAYHTYEYAATTNPWVVGALVEMALDAGAKQVRVMDYPFGGSAEQAYVKSGIQEQVERAGGKMEIMSRLQYVDAEIPEGIDLQVYKIYDSILKADVVIDVPIAKHHGLARLTLGMKNLMGVIYNRPAMHQNLGQRLADITSRVRPTLTVVDAVRMLMNHGPAGGSLDDVKKADTVIVSPDIVAADSYAATLFDLRPEDLSYVRAATAMGLGRSDLDGLRIEEIQVGG